MIPTLSRLRYAMKQEKGDPEKVQRRNTVTMASLTEEGADATKEKVRNDADVFMRYNRVVH